VKRNVDRDEIATRQKGMWRWFELLPVKDKKNIVSLGEGDTPILQLNRLGSEMGFTHLFLKEEGLNPTGSFKARGLSSAISKAKELGITKVVIPSAGNAGGAMAAYAARGGLESLIYMPKNSPNSNIEESRITGSTVILIDGLINDAAKFAEEISKSEGWFDLSTFKEPYRVEGKKIMGFEVAQSFQWTLPDVIIYPTGGGTGLVGMWKAFIELDALGWLNSNNRPRMIAVQAEGCAPVVNAFHSGSLICAFWKDAHTIATGLCVPKSFADQNILRDIRESNGTAISVSDEMILDSQRKLARKEGIFAAPEGAATLAGLTKLINLGLVHSDERIILFNTGSGLKYIN
jgi:threonine synthase